MKDKDKNVIKEKFMVGAVVILATRYFLYSKPKTKDLLINTFEMGFHLNSLYTLHV